MFSDKEINDTKDYDESTTRNESYIYQKDALFGLAEKYIQATIKKEELEAEICVIRDLMLELMPCEKIDNKNWTLSKTSRIKWLIDIDSARNLGATKASEELDTKELKTLLASGADIPHEKVIGIRFTRREETKQ